MMVEKYKIRTDLAMEQKERFESDHVEVSGVVLEEEYDEEKEIKITYGPSASGVTSRLPRPTTSTEYPFS